MRSSRSIRFAFFATIVLLITPIVAFAADPSPSPSPMVDTTVLAITTKNLLGYIVGGVMSVVFVVFATMLCIGMFMRWSRSAARCDDDGPVEYTYTAGKDYDGPLPGSAEWREMFGE